MIFPVTIIHENERFERPVLVGAGYAVQYHFIHVLLFFI